MSKLIAHLHTWCGLSINLECRSETCCAQLAENTARKKSPKSRHLGTIAQLCRAISSQLRHVSTIGKKLLSSNISSTSIHNMVNFGRLAAEVVSLVWGTPANFNGFCVLERYCTVLQQWASAKLCGVEQRAPPIFGRAAITLGTGPHFYSQKFLSGPCHLIVRTLVTCVRPLLEYRLYCSNVRPPHLNLSYAQS